MTTCKIGDRVRIVGDSPANGKAGTIVMWGFVPNWVLVKLPHRFKTRQHYMHHTDELEFLETQIARPQ